MLEGNDGVSMKMAYIAIQEQFKQEYYKTIRNEKN